MNGKKSLDPLPPVYPLKSHLLTVKFGTTVSGSVLGLCNSLAWTKRRVLKEVARMRELLLACAKRQSTAVKPVKTSMFHFTNYYDLLRRTDIFLSRDAKDHRLACGFLGLLESAGVTKGSGRQTTSPPSQTTKEKENESETPNPDPASLASLTLEEID